ncbi:hypothetical protein LDX54_07395 [Lactobacillus sp. IBH004]|uniref:hypothetical protein n=1 Tax=Lactobacillus TaxID=1578 RepID=UPI000EFB2DA3|nr:MULTISPECIES: hypothetical protein [Lactobacillus]MBC6348914.1 hypothetical protein [Lactobacillus melliventris]RMC61780.1 hypothetical protein F5ESL0259_03350 [Lactobacillus sp. ESL0259]UZN41587.1 hypothetical protein LDX54_07395 [Lactobacillus sp. IBH004]
MKFLWIIALIIFVIYIIISDKKLKNRKDYKEALTPSKNPSKELLVKRWWVWGLVLVLICGFFVPDLNNAENHDETYKTSSHHSKKPSSVKKRKSLSDYASKKVTKFMPVKNTAKAVTLGAGKYKVGRDIKPGRYVIKAVKGNGNLSNSDFTINVILGKNVKSDQVTSFTTNLIKNDKIKLDWIESTSFTPTPDKYTYKTKLSAGIWLVGLDIKPGRYVIRPIKGRGNLISEDGSDDNLNEILGKDAKRDQVSKVTADLTAGEVILSTLELIGLSKK